MPPGQFPYYLKRVDESDIMMNENSCLVLKSRVPVVSWV